MAETEQQAEALRPRVHDVVVVGGGFSSLAVLAELRGAGFDDVRVLERADSLGGTWRDNTYPGCACDVPSHLYSLSFAPRADWSRTYAPWHEIRDYALQVARDLDLERHFEFGRAVVEATYEGGVWRVRCADGTWYGAHHLVLATGALSEPAVPDLDGLAGFDGPVVHSARWPADLDVRSKRVLVVGTGASAVQFVPWLQQNAAHMTVVQRTPPWVLPRRDRAYGPFARWAFAKVPGLRWLYRQSIFWRCEARVLAFEHPALMKLVKRWGRAHIARAVKDPALRARLEPTYTPGCKRLLLSDDYYPALAQPNVRVVTDRITRVGPRHVELEGEAGPYRVETDVLVFGTGFAVHALDRRLSVVGPEGRSLADAWAQGAEAYLGTMVAGFPNLYLMTGPNTGLGHNSMLVMIEAQARQIRHVLSHLRANGLAAAVPRAAVQAAYNTALRVRARKTVWLSGCRSWYLDEHGRNATLWIGLASRFAARLRRFVAQDYEYTPPEKR
jgi:cation diffusion facilitator CzcD-associated flavoprotein CzcO